ncbi:hypothetical protein N7466_005449 [Penicillium verhagenii]|uniref:uncharacterized protein n=1 Tax=Penicillium verhagenii TaxID=1562060 RepID=UPI002545AA6C|nr:uncharacterized protein N7466_005449 [Penicillium verhagenii]KAJ5929956.1 hypothetical protein N7466_005449 [Penicillium verhagenii]
MTTRFPQTDKYHDEIIKMEEEKYGTHHHHHITHNDEAWNTGPERVPHREPETRVTGNFESGEGEFRIGDKKNHPGKRF